jgi:uncharacterized membrane protein
MAIRNSIARFTMAVKLNETRNADAARAASHRLVGQCFLIAASLLLAAAPASAASYTVFDVPGGLETEPASINDQGEIAGTYATLGGGRGFVRNADGTFTLFDPRKSTETGPTGINKKGWVAGSYSKRDGVYPYEGFIRRRNGHVIRIADESGDVFVRGISRYDAVCGVKDGHGFIRSADGTLIEFDPSGSNYTEATSVNASGIVAGYFGVDGPSYHGFVRAVDGTIAVLDAPDSIGTFPAAIITNGSVAGSYYDGNGAPHGFVWNADAGFTSFDAATSIYVMYVDGMSDSGSVVGWYEGHDYLTHGFVRSPNGTIKTFDVPGSDGSTVAIAINSDGAIVGSFRDRDGKIHGFLRTPRSKHM